MTITDQRLVAPRRVEVVPAASVEPIMSDVAIELSLLEKELRDLEAEASGLESQVEEARRRRAGGDVAAPLIEQVFAEQAATMQAELAAALEDAVRAAELRLATARAEATAAAGGVPVTRFDSRPNRRPAAAAHPLTRQQANGHVPPAAPLIQPQVVPASAPVERRDRPAPAPEVTVLQPAYKVHQEQHSEVKEADQGAFGQFWDAEAASPARRPSRAGLVDAILPMVAVVIMLLVLLTWTS